MNALRAVGAETPISANGADAPSLWPALQRQIRETRHLPRPSVFAEFVSRFGRPSYRFAAMAATGVVAAAATWVVAGSWAQSQILTAKEITASASRPILVSPVVPHSAIDFGPSVVKTDVESSSKSPDRIPSRFGYDLDRGTVSNSGDAGQIKPSY